MLLKAKHENNDNSLTFDDIQEEVDTFMFAGHDTTACSITWVCHNLCLYPEIQKKVHEELDNIFGDSERHVSNEDLGKLNYLERVIKETMRLFPVVLYVGRELSEDIEIDGYRIEKGKNVTINIGAIHRDERYYPNPEKFDPDRFLPENSKDRHPYAFIPFSAGKRNCIGQRFAMMELKILLASILQKFTIHSDKTTAELRPSSLAVLVPKNGLPVKLKLRNKN